MPPSQAPNTDVDLDAIAPDALDRLDQGVIGLDSAGTVVAFSEGASAISGLSREAVLGRDYFRDVMPGTNVPNFRGRFLAGARRGTLDETFDYVFGRLPQPLRARIHMRHGQIAGGSPVTWLTIDPVESLGADHSREAVMAAIGRRVRAEPVDASLCEREPIHIPGSIQPNAVMLAADAGTLLVVAYSANVGEIVDPIEPPLAGRPLADVLPADFVAAIRARLARGTLHDGASLRRTLAFPGRGTAYHAVAHAHAGRLIVEMELEPDSADDFATASQADTELAVGRLREAGTLADIARIAALEIRALTGFEAVLVYRFDTDWNGEAVAEDKVPDWSRSLLGLRFPASDIPAQARALYTKAKSRFVIDRDSVPVGLVSAPGAGNGPIDLTFAQHRTLSPIHLEYQRNLGVNGSMSISIMVEGRLWGLMIGHHRRPHYVTPETRAAATVLTDAFAMRVQEIESRRLWAERQAHLDVEGRLVRGLTRSDDFVAALTGGTTTLLDLFGATGAGIVSGDRVTGIGRTPPVDMVAAIAGWLRAGVPAGEVAYSSDSFTADYPEAGPHREIASGLLAVFVDASRENLLLWFRPEVPSTVTWGGDPRKPVLAGSGPVAVLPRRSFERWVEERTGFAAPWAEWQVHLAGSLAEAVEGVVLRQRRKIDELTGLLAEKERLLEQKDLLTREIDHRVKNSLQIVSAFLQMQRRQIADGEARQAFADTSARVMSVARVHDSLYQADRFDEVDLGQTIESLCNDLAGLAGDGHAVDLSAEPGLMVPYRKAVALSLIATELVTNAFKYAANPTGGGRVEVSVSASGPGEVQLRVCDDGSGLPDDWADAKARSKGSGLGMKLIRAMLDQINAKLTVANNPGACFTITA
ncbi:bacteriophytochrome [Methylobacterium phyllosphaerae]|uniref:Bacteriophytochrome n=2 Tax=Methylobacterium TaxID=407 RepID=A0AAE8HP15_9HYPH|nr:MULTISPECIES: histidine kinase dimerization/phosphoacceptor domain -containing protein [Methylobacterium]KOX50598.1 histidine kinase [Streptomyces purpurogeneiscleroticus]APT32498.1 bacteriophytochrome [Methylobacterium phyllosphaerae]AWV16289.1 histidine kinase [Methylobacterium sp. XJLW]MBA9065011.1 photoactive yellow protein [Methylobacterium fujisawaense]MDE4911720.1 histidine kinase dimerization/phosphoacceptor domain -containing protein [Methylobacterium sp. 092160098-2]